MRATPGFFSSSLARLHAVVHGLRGDYKGDEIALMGEKLFLDVEKGEINERKGCFALLGYLSEFRFVPSEVRDGCVGWGLFIGFAAHAGWSLGMGVVWCGVE